jgi:PAS domain S-box-containing protein
VNKPPEAGVPKPMDGTVSNAPESTLQRNARAGFTVAIFLTCLLSAISWRAAQQASEDADWVTHTQEVSTTLESTLRHLLDVESGVRGFALTGRPAFLEPFNTGRYAVGQDLLKLRRLTANSADQQRRLDVLEKQANLMIEEAGKVVAARQSGGPAPSEAQFETGKQVMDSARVTIAEMEDAENFLLEQRTIRARATQRFTLSLIALGALLGVAFLSVAAVTVSRQIEIGDRVRAQIDSLNADLERRVEQRTAALQAEITIRKQAEDEIKKQAALLDLAHDAIIVRDLESRVVFWNRGAQQFYGWTAGEASGKVTHDLLQTRFPLPLAEIEAVLASKGDWEGELRHITHRGADVVVASRWSLQRDESGLPTRILEINRDITDSKLAEAALRESEGRVAGIVQSAMDPIITTDEEQRIVLFNNAAERVFQCTAADALGSPINRFIPQRFHAAHAGHIGKFGETGVTNRTMGPRDVLWAVRADGQEFPIEASISQAVTDGKKFFTIILRDVTERRQAEALRERMAAVVEFSDDAIISATLDGTILAWNRGAEKVFGYPSCEAIGSLLSMIIPAERAHEKTELLGWVAQGNSVKHFETVRVRKDGKQIDVSVTISPIRDRNGTVVSASTIARDITRSKRVEAALKHSEETLRRTLEGARLGTWEQSLATGEVVWSPLCFDLFGIPPGAKVESQTIFSLIHPDDAPLVNEAVRRTLEDRTECDVEYRIHWPDGTERWIASKGKVYQNASGECTHLAGIVFDITERQRAAQKMTSQALELSWQAATLIRSQHALESKTILLQSVLESVDEGLVAADENGKFILWNAAATRIVGMGAEDVAPGEWNAHYGVYLPDTVTPLPVERNPLSRAIQGMVSAEEIFLRNEELGKGAWIEISGRPLIGGDGSTRGGVVAFRDITHKKAAELEIRKLNESLEERIAHRTSQLQTANRELEAFTYSVSHDLRAPLRHIQGFLAAFLEEFGATADPQALHYLQRVQDGTRRMGLLIDELLNLARTGRQPLCLQQTELGSIVQDTISMLNAETTGREVEWKICDLPSVNCDPVLVRQIFQNLLANAIKYTRPRSRAVIEIGHTKERDGSVIFVRDNGVGFDMQYAGKLFGVFQRLHRDEEFEGTGVGLATVYRIVQKHGGRIWAEAELDRGATFYFTLDDEFPNAHIDPDAADTHYPFGSDPCGEATMAREATE